MMDHTCRIEASKQNPVVQFADNFNVAVPFIDRHLREGRGDKTMLTTATGDTVNYAQLADAVNRCGNVLLQSGLSRGDRVLMMIKDCPAFLYVFWGAIKAGFIPVPINTLLRAHDYAYMIEDSDCRGVIYSPEFADDVEQALTLVSTTPDVVLPTEGEAALDNLINKASSTLDPAPATATDECFWLYSSGSTGRPKGAVHLHRDMVITSQFYGVETLGVTEQDCCFSAAKLFFAYGLGNGMTFPLWVGGSAVLYGGRPTPDATFEVIEKYRPSLYFGVPTLYAAQLQVLESSHHDLSSIRYCVSAGEALPADVYKRWKQQTGLKILDGIGSTEALHIFISNRPDDIKPGTSGRMVHGYEAKIIDEQGAPVAIGEGGRLLIRGDSTAKYYWNNPQKTASTMVDGWLDTGDTYFEDEEGYYHYCGRNDDMLKVGGIWCSPFEIEACLIEHPKVLEAAIIGRKDTNDLIKPAAYIVLNHPEDAGEALQRELHDHCRAGMAHYKYPRWFTFVAELPKTATGKIQRFKLRELCS
ncbi:MAG TPA: benzoate-CoA ligase family protein [Gammaproteobacteria bacterium]|nr:benzoate-CoA ligase family protein [Gammaproteobacteria bacterium]